jgi:hypothetical protein
MNGLTISLAEAFLLAFLLGLVGLLVYTFLRRLRSFPSARSRKWIVGLTFASLFLLFYGLGSGNPLGILLGYLGVAFLVFILIEEYYLGRLEAKSA